MNIDNVRMLRDRLDEVRQFNPGRFNMSDFTDPLTMYGQHDPRFNPDPHACGTAACLGGWAAMLASPFEVPLSVMYMAEEWLGLTLDERTHWFCGSWARDQHGDAIPLNKITIDHAITFLDRVLETGDTMVTLTFHMECDAMADAINDLNTAINAEHDAEEAADRVTNITDGDREAFGAVRDPEVSNIAMFSCFLLQEKIEWDEHGSPQVLRTKVPTVAICAVTVSDDNPEDVTITPMYVRFENCMTLVDHDGTPAMPNTPTS